MANVVQTNIVVDGSRNTVVHVTIVGDGSAELTNQVIYNASTAVNPTVNLKLWEIEYALDGFAGQLSWDATPPQFFYDLVRDKDTHHKFKMWGGYVNNGLTAPTGNILLTTLGLVGAPSNGHITLFLKKRGSS